MLILGIVLLVVGAVVAYIGRPREQLILIAGVIIFAVGVIFVLIGLLSSTGADVHTHAAAVGLLPLGWRRLMARGLRATANYFEPHPPHTEAAVRLAGWRWDGQHYVPDKTHLASGNPVMVLWSDGGGNN